MPLKNNRVDFSSIVKLEAPIYDFCLYNPVLKNGIMDSDGWINQEFYKTTNQQVNHVPSEVSLMNLLRIYDFLKAHVPENGLIVEIGVWRDPSSSYTSTKLFLDNRPKGTEYLGIDIETRNHVINYGGEKTYMMYTDSADTEKITNVIKNTIHKEIDFLFIDGLHSLEQVKKELALIPLVKKGGVIGFHDIAFHCGPNIWMDAFDPTKFDIYKFYRDDDWGVGFLVKKF
jgi:hypothetical protein